MDYAALASRGGAAAPDGGMQLVREEEGRQRNATAAMAVQIMIGAGFVEISDGMDLSCVSRDFARYILGQETSWRSLLRVSCRRKETKELFVSATTPNLSTSAVAPVGSSFAMRRQTMMVDTMSVCLDTRCGACSALRATCFCWDVSPAALHRMCVHPDKTPHT